MRTLDDPRTLTPDALRFLQQTLCLPIALQLSVAPDEVLINWSGAALVATEIYKLSADQRVAIGTPNTLANVLFSMTRKLHADLNGWLMAADGDQVCSVIGRSALSSEY